MEELSQAYILYDGLTINMDGAPEETFWLRQGFGPPRGDGHARDGKGRQIHNDFSLCFERWQTRDIKLEMGLYPESGCQNLTLLVNNKHVATRELAAGYQELVLAIPDEALAAGENIATIQLNGSSNCTAMVDYVRWHIGQSTATGKPEVDQRLVDGKKVSVIGTAVPYEINLYTSTPQYSHLKLTLGHDGDGGSGSPGRLRIWNQAYSSGGKLLWEGDFPAGGNRKLDLDLGNFPNELTLLSFEVTPKPNGTDWLYLADPQLSFPQQPILPKQSPPLVINNRKPRTIVLIFEDAMRRDLLSVYGNQLVRTPNFEAVAKSGVVFDNAYAPSNWTLPSFASVFTSLPFTRLGATHKIAIMVEDVPTLAEILGHNGWETAIFTSNIITGPRAGLARGFGKIFELYQLHPGQQNFTVEDYTSLLQSYLSNLGSHDTFITLHLMDTHEPFSAPQEYVDYYTGIYDRIKTAMPWLGGTYQGFPPEVITRKAVEEYSSVNLSDTDLPKIVQCINQYRDPDNTIFVLLSDHGEEMWDHGSFGHGMTLYEELVHIPLVVWGDGVVAGRNAQLVSSMDVLPTVLELSGIAPPAGIQGVSFASKLNGDVSVQKRPIFSAMQKGDISLKCVVYDGWKLIYNDFSPQLFNLVDDPREINNQATTNPIAFGFMRGKLRQWWMDIYAQGVKENDKQLILSEQEIEILKGLGYVQK